MRKQTNYLLLRILLFAALLCGLHSCTPCKDEGMEYKQFEGWWKIIGYTRNGQDLLDSLVVKDTLQRIAFGTTNQAETPECLYILPSYIVVEGYSADSAGKKQLNGSWTFYNNFFYISIDESEALIKNPEGIQTYYHKKYSTSNERPKFTSLPFIFDLKWVPTFNADSLQLDGKYQNENYQLILQKSK